MLKYKISGITYMHWTKEIEGDGIESATEQANALASWSWESIEDTVEVQENPPSDIIEVDVSQEQAT